MFTRLHFVPLFAVGAGNKQKSNYNPADAKHKQPPFKQIGTSLSTHGFEQTKNI